MREVENLAICTLSGGFDSTAAMLWSLERQPTRALFIDFGGPYGDQEYAAFFYLVNDSPLAFHPNFKGAKTKRVDLSVRGTETPWVPYRNLVIAAVALNQAIAHKARAIVFGSKSLAYRPDDPVSFMDSTLGFYQSLDYLAYRYTEPHNQPSPNFQLPLIDWNKKQVMDYIDKAGINLHKLWNCYFPNEMGMPCGGCAHCKTTLPLLSQY